jgi:hypothetical protein
MNERKDLCVVLLRCPAPGVRAVTKPKRNKGGYEMLEILLLPLKLVLFAVKLLFFVVLFAIGLAFLPVAVLLLLPLLLLLAFVILLKCVF